jgi:hypothetical protein
MAEPCWECQTPTTRRHENPALSFPLCESCADLAPEADAWIAALGLMMEMKTPRTNPVQPESEKATHVES